MMQPGFATMLCFVQTDAALADPGGRAAPRRRALVRAHHRRRPDVHQRHRACSRRPARPAVTLPEGLLDAVLLQLALGDRRRRRGGDPGRPRPGARGRRRRRGRARRPRDRQLAARQDRPLRPRPELGAHRPGGGDGARGRAAATSSAPAAIDAEELGARRTPEAEIAVTPRPRRRIRGTSRILRTSTTTTSGSTRSTRRDATSRLLRFASGVGGVGGDAAGGLPLHPRLPRVLVIKYAARR